MQSSLVWRGYWESALQSGQLDHRAFQEHAALAMGIELAEKEDAEIVIGTDPDCDRMGVAVRNRPLMSVELAYLALQTKH